MKLSEEILNNGINIDSHNTKVAELIQVLEVLKSNGVTTIEFVGEVNFGSLHCLKILINEIDINIK